VSPTVLSGAETQTDWQASGYAGNVPYYPETTMPTEVQGQHQYNAEPYSGQPNRAMRGRGTGRWRARRLPRDVCARCHGHGHWKAECPAAGYRPEPGDFNGGHFDNPTYGSYRGQPAPHVQVMSGVGRSETYIDVTIKGRNLLVLLDTGCEQSVCPLRMCKNAKITPAHAELYAANSTPISVVGTTRLFFEIQGVPSHADVFVSDDIDELILGYNFLQSNKCEWLFNERRIVINGMSIPLCSRPLKGSVRRIYVREPIVVPNDTSVNVSGSPTVRECAHPQKQLAHRTTGACGAPRLTSSSHTSEPQR